MFCFIDQMPKGMRETLYFKDDDSRLSFLQGNYITLTNMSDHDVERIVKYRLEPVENIYFFQRLSRKPVVQHLAAKFGIFRLERNIDRLQTVLYNTLHIMITHIGQRNIIALQK